MMQETDLKKIPEVRRVLADFLVNVRNVSSDRLDVCIDGWCETAQKRKVWSVIRMEIIYALWISKYSNQQISTILNVSLRTVGRDLAEIKEAIDPFKEFRGKTVDKWIQKHSKELQPYIDAFWDRTLSMHKK